MKEPVTQHVNLHPDIEFSGRLGKALNSQGAAQFSLMLAALQQDYLARLRFEQQNNDATSTKPIPAELQYYPVQPIYAEEQDWRNMQIQKQLWQQQQFASARLSHVIHPSPLAFKDRTQTIDPIIIDNAGLRDVPNKQPEHIEVDETSLFELLNELRPDYREQNNA